ncbi:hypothetical protein M5X04_14630 [Paenibacillus alvei]|uniref:Uncharacterized protein n=1 Tax=Paenibacillus alvei TaxID=44250 RepID=A0ABT4EBT6_PAEAL|nr:hypothetical protein [Paenibacillus alvei]MCY9530555.1 hypothetical protein [Paenibacillus alvei]
MNKLTDEQLKELRELYRDECKWAADPEHVRTLLQEVERLNNEMDGLLTIVEDKNSSAHDVFISLKQDYVKLEEEVERLKGQLQDALNTLERIVAMPYTLPDVCKDFAQLLSKETIQRIQEGTADGDS